jgi:hypothetical protein
MMAVMGGQGRNSHKDGQEKGGAKAGPEAEPIR